MAGRLTGMAGSSSAQWLERGLPIIQDQGAGRVGFLMRDVAMIEILSVLGSRHEPAFAEPLHQLEHRGVLDTVTIAVADLARRRLLVTTAGGQQLAIALPRHQKLFDGAVLLLDDARAIVVRAATERWLRLEPASAAAAIELGYHAGNLHWRVRFDGEALLVALEGRPEDYTARLADLIGSHRVAARIMEGGDAGLHHHVHEHQGRHYHSPRDHDAENHGSQGRRSQDHGSRS